MKQGSYVTFCQAMQRMHDRSIALRDEWPASGQGSSEGPFWRAYQFLVSEAREFVEVLESLPKKDGDA